MWKVIPQKQEVVQVITYVDWEEVDISVQVLEAPCKLSQAYLE